MKQSINNLNKELSDLKNSISQREKEFYTQLNAKDQKIYELNTQINNPEKTMNYKLYEPKIAIASCLSASKILLENAHKFYSEDKFQEFLESVDYMRRELGICLDSLSRENFYEIELKKINKKYEKILGENIGYRNDNKKLFDLNKILANENSALKNIKEFVDQLFNKHIIGIFYDNELHVINLIKNLYEVTVQYFLKYNETVNVQKRFNLLQKQIGSANYDTEITNYEIRRLQKQVIILQAELDDLCNKKEDYLLQINVIRDKVQANY